MTGNGDYLSFYGLKEPPFGVSPDRRFLYLGHSLSVACGQMVEALRRRDGIVVVTGESGVGKSAVCPAIVEEILKPRYLSIVVDPLLTVPDLLRQILNDFAKGAPEAVSGSAGTNETPHDLLRRLDRFVASRPPDALAVVLIDEAQHLTADVLAWLRVLSNLEDERGKTLQIVLLGQPSLENLLGRTEARHLNQRITRRCQLPSMSPREIQRYMAFRLRMGRSERVPAAPRPDAGESGVQDLEVSEETLAPFSPGALRTLAIVSAGVPRAINLIADSALRIGFERKRLAITPAMIRAAAKSLDRPLPFAARLSPSVVAAAVAVIALAAGITALGSWSPRLFSWRPSAWTRSTASQGNEPRARTAPVETRAARTEPAAGLRPSLTEGAPGRDETLTRSEAYLLMVASFKVEQNAARLARSLAEKNLPAFVVPDPATQWFAVAIGPYASVGEVNEVKTDVAKRFNLAETHVRVERP